MSKEYTSSNPYIKVRIDKLFDDESKLKAFATVIVGGTYAAHGLKVFKSDEKGLFVTMPSISYVNREGETVYKDQFHPVTKQGYKMLQETVLEAYRIKVEGKEEPVSEYEYEDYTLLDLPFD